MLSVDEIMQILRSLMCVCFCGGSCIEDVSTHLIRHLSSHPKIRTCSADTILRAIKELTTSNITYTSPASRKSYDFNTADKMNELLVRSLISTGELRKGQMYDLDFDQQFIETEKYDAKPTYKKFTGYSPRVAVIGDHIVGIENRDGNANVRFHQQDTLESIFTRLEKQWHTYKQGTHGLRLLFGGDSRHCKGTLQAFLYPREQVFGFL